MAASEDQLYLTMSPFCPSDLRSFCVISPSASYFSHTFLDTLAMTVPVGQSSKLFEPLTIGNGKIKLEHRVVLAPLTRNRGTPLCAESTPDMPNRTWLPNDLMVEYYMQRASHGGLTITEGVPPSLEVSTIHYHCNSRANLVNFLASHRESG